MTEFDESSSSLTNHDEYITSVATTKFDEDDTSLLTAAEEWRKAKRLINTAILFRRRLDKGGRSLSDPEIQVCS